MAQPGHSFPETSAERQRAAAGRRAAPACDLLHRLSPDERAALLETGVARRYAPGELICRKGDAAGQIYLLLGGRLKVTTCGSDGRSITLALVEPGELFGEIAVFDDSPRTASVVPLEASEIRCIERRAFAAFLQSHPSAAMKLLSALAAKMRRLSDLVEDALFLDLPRRLARKLLSLADVYGTPCECGVRITLTLSQRELGELVAVSRESINKQLRAWSDSGLLRIADLQIEILERGRLQQIADPLGERAAV